jgi:hypothetical protein
VTRRRTFYGTAVAVVVVILLLGIVVSGVVAELVHT